MRNGHVTVFPQPSVFVDLQIAGSGSFQLEESRMRAWLAGAGS
jgi:hypothetical protein